MTILYLSASDQEHQYRAVASFTATNPGEISFEEGSVLTVVEKTDRGTCLLVI